MKISLLIQGFLMLLYDGTMLWYFGYEFEYIAIVIVIGNLLVGSVQLLQALFLIFNPKYQKPQLKVYLLLSFSILILMIMDDRLNTGFELFWPLMICSWIMANVYPFIYWSLIRPGFNPAM